MKFSAKTNVDFRVVPEGSHVGICNMIVDLGLQPGWIRFPNPIHKVYIHFETPTLRTSYIKDGIVIDGPMAVGSILVASMCKTAHLRNLIEGWLGAKFPNDDAAGDFDLEMLLGMRCVLNVKHKAIGSKTRANIESAAPLPREIVSTEAQINPSVKYSVNAPDVDVYLQLPEWLRRKIDSRVHEDDDAVSENREEEAPGADKLQVSSRASILHSTHVNYVESVNITPVKPGTGVLVTTKLPKRMLKYYKIMATARMAQRFKKKAKS